MFCCGQVLVHTHVVVVVFHVQLLLLDAAVFHYAGCYDVFICIRGDGLGDERKLVPHVVESV